MPQAAIIGGGLAGTVLALNLHKRSVTCAIYESRAEDDSHDGGNIALAPNGLRVLDRFGAYEGLRISGFNYEEMTLVNDRGTELGSVLNGSHKLYNFPALRIKRSILLRELINRVQKQGIPMYWNKKCIGIVSETVATSDRKGSATAAFADGEQATADFIVACDGIHSHVRSFVAPNAEDPSYTGQVGISGHIMAADLNRSKDKDDFQLPCILFGKSGSIGIMPSSFDGNDIGWFANLEVADRSREEWAKFGGDGKELKKLLSQHFLETGNAAKLPDMVRQLVTKANPEDLKHWPFYTLPPLPSWSSQHKRVLLIGDAAHAIPPTGGQGASMAFEDADTLSYVLERAYSPDFQQEHLEELIAKWQSHRQARVAKITEFTTMNGTLRKATSHLYEQAAKELIIWAALKLKPQADAGWIFSYNPEEILASISR